MPIPVTVFSNGMHVLYSQPPFIADEDLHTAVRRLLSLGGPDAVRKDEDIVKRLTAGVEYPIEYIEVIDKTTRRWPATNRDVTRGH